MTIEGTDSPGVPEPRIMLVTAPLHPVPSGGRALLSRVIHDALVDIYGPALIVDQIPPAPRRGLSSIAAALVGYVDGLSPSVIREVANRAKSEGVSKILIDGSNFGLLARGFKLRCHGVEISTFFHNCEARFFLGSLLHSPSFRALGVLLANYRAERLAVKCSDKLICLSPRDSQQLGRVYGRNGTHSLPMAMHDQSPNNLPEAPAVPAERYALFVGGTFYANRQGMEWYVEHVAAKAPIKTYVVGKGFEQWKSRLERNGNVEVVGSVDSLVPWYLGAHFVIAPIFDGSGMKTKVAEALMFGKRVVGTPEAFVGYEAVVDGVGSVCQTPAEFLAALEREAVRPFLSVDRELRRSYEDRYSFRAARDQLAEILTS